MHRSSLTRLARLFLLLGAVTFHAPRLEAAAVQWTSDASGAWNTAGNWSSNPSLPGANDDVTVDRPSAAITVTHLQGNDSIKSLLCNESLTLSGGSLTVAAASLVNGSFSATQGASLTASGAGASFTATGPTQLAGCGLYASGGGAINLPWATSYINGTSNVTLKADGLPSKIDLSGLTTFGETSGSGALIYVQAINSGKVDLRSVATFTSGAVQFQADGSGSRIDLSAMTSFSGNSSSQQSSITATRGGSVLMGNLASLDKVNLTLDATSTMATGQIAAYTQGTAAITGAAPDFSGMTGIDGASFRAYAGAVIAVPNATSYNERFNVAFKNDYFNADGAGSRLDLSGLTRIVGGTAAFNQTTIQATSGGRVDLRNLPRWETGSVAILADGAASVVDLSGMTTFTAAAVSNGACTLAARNGGTVLMGNLTSVDKLNLTIDGTGTMATGQIASYTNGTATISGTAPDFSGLTSISGSTFTITGVLLNLAHMANASNATFDLKGGGNVRLDGAASVESTTFKVANGVSLNLAAAANIDGAGFRAYSGATILVPSATSYNERFNVAFKNDYFTADGAGSRLDLSALTRIVGGTGAFNQTTIQATAGGRVDLHNLPKWETGSVAILADGAASVVDLGGMTAFTAAAVSNGACTLAARNGGTVLMGNLASVDKLNLTIDGTGTMATSQIASYTNGTATISGTAPDFSGLANISGSTFTVTGVLLDLAHLTSVAAATFDVKGGGNVRLDNAASVDAASFKVAGGVTLAVPRATSYVDARTGAWSNNTLTATGSASLLDLSTLTTLKGSMAAFSIVTVQAMQGGRVDLRNLPAFDTGTMQVTADGAGSVVNLSSMAWFTPNNTFANTSSLTASNGGTILLGPTTVSVSGTNVSAAAGGTVTAGGLQLLSNGTLAVASGGTLNVPTLQLAGGTISGNGSLSQPISGSSGTLQTANSTDTLALNGPLTLAGTLTKSGGGKVVLAADDSAGSVIVTAGTLLVNAALTTGSPVSVQSGATLGGRGSLRQAIALAAGATIAPGDAACGRLTLAAGGTLGGAYAWCLAALRDDATGAAGVDFDQLALSGGSLAGTNPILAISFLNSTAPDAGDAFWNASHAWTVLDNTGPGTLGLSGLRINGYGTNGVGARGSFAVLAAPGVGGDATLTWSPVPEPSAIAMLIAGGLTLAAAAARRIGRKGRRREGLAFPFGAG